MLVLALLGFKIALSGRNVEWLPRVHFFALTAPGSVIALAQLGHITGR